MSKNAQGNKDSVTLLVTVTLKPESEQSFLAYVPDLVRMSLEEPGVILYVMTKHPTEPHTYVAVERYRDAAAFKAHNESPHMADAMAKLPGWITKPPQVVPLSQIAPT